MRCASTCPVTSCATSTGAPRPRPSTLQIRQYHDTRRSHLTVVLDDAAATPTPTRRTSRRRCRWRPRSPPGPHREGVDVSMLCGEHAVTGRGLDGVLDACCRIQLERLRPRPGSPAGAAPGPRDQLAGAGDRWRGARRGSRERCAATCRATSSCCTSGADGAAPTAVEQRHAGAPAAGAAHARRAAPRAPGRRAGACRRDRSARGGCSLDLVGRPGASSASRCSALTRTFDGWGFLVCWRGGAALGLLVAARHGPAARWRRRGRRAPGRRWCSAARSRMRADRFGGGIPDPGSVADVLRGQRGPAWGELLTTLPWVDLDGPPALVPFLLGYVGAVAAVLLALRTRSAGGAPAPAAGRPGGRAAAAPSGRHRQPAARLVPRRLRRRGDRLAGGAGPAGRSRRRRPRCATTAAWDARVSAGLVLAAAPSPWPCRSPSRSSADGTPVSAGEPCAAAQDALPDLSGLDSPLRRFRTFTEQEEGSLENVHEQGAVHRHRCSRRAAGCGWSPSTATTVSEWLPGKRHRGARLQRRLPAPGHPRRQPLQRPAGRGPGQRQWRRPTGARGCRRSAR